MIYQVGKAKSLKKVANHIILPRLTLARQLKQWKWFKRSIIKRLEEQLLFENMHY